MTKTMFLLRFAELSLKSQPVRKQMVKRLMNNLKDALARREIAYHIEPQWSRLFLTTPQPDEARAVLAHLFGLQSFSEVHRTSYEGYDALLSLATPYFAPHLEGQQFAVRCRRDKDLTAFSTQRVERELGAALSPYAAGVNLSRADVTCHVELRSGELFLYADKERGVGGLPLGVESPCLALLSGGFDSPVASWLAMRRGVPCDFLFFELGGLTHRAPIYAHARHLYDNWIFGRRPKLFVLPGEPIVEALRETIPPKYWNVMLKRVFYRLGEAIARRANYTALITGESIAQVSSQTLTNLSSIEHGLSVPVLRPLLTHSKTDIIEIARRIGSFAISEGVQEYCAITPRTAATAAPLHKIQAFEEALGGEEFYRSMAPHLERLRVHAIAPEQIHYLHVLTDEVPDDAVWIDMRDNPQPPLSHPAEVISLPELVQTPEQLSPQRSYFLLCEVGMQSMEAAYMLQEMGYQAVAYEGGTEQLRKKTSFHV